MPLYVPIWPYMSLYAPIWPYMPIYPSTFALIHPHQRIPSNLLIVPLSIYTNPSNPRIQLHRRTVMYISVQLVVSQRVYTPT